MLRNQDKIWRQKVSFIFVSSVSFSTKKIWHINAAQTDSAASSRANSWGKEGRYKVYLFKRQERDWKLQTSYLNFSLYNNSNMKWYIFVNTLKIEWEWVPTNVNLTGAYHSLWISFSVDRNFWICRMIYSVYLDLTTPICFVWYFHKTEIFMKLLWGMFRKPCLVVINGSLFSSITYWAVFCRDQSCARFLSMFSLVTWVIEKVVND